MILLLLIFFNTRKVSNLLFANGIVLYPSRLADEANKDDGSVDFYSDEDEDMEESDDEDGARQP